MEKKGSNIFERDEFTAMTAGLELAQCMLRGKISTLDPHTISPEVSRQLEDLVVADAHSCSCCSVKFPTPAAQRAHFKLDWHRYNLKRQLAGLPFIREEAFTDLADKGDDIESISGSESESEEEGEKSEGSEPVPSRHARAFFKNANGLVVSVYRCLLTSSKDCPEFESLVSTTLELPQNDKWAIIMLGGGHFAAGIFKGQEPLVHKTFHCYTVRAKQGGSQSSRDSKGGNHPKSAGASLRRYNEQALVQHVQDLISTWAEHFKTCNLIFYRAVGPHNRAVLFGGKTPPLDKTDRRLRTIPFPTRRATFSEVKRVHGMLSFMELHGLDSEFESNYPPALERKYIATKEDSACGKSSDTEADKEVSPRRNKNKGGFKPNRAKSRASPQRPLPAALSRTSSESETVGDSKKSITWENKAIDMQGNVENFENVVVKNQMRQNKVSQKQKKLKEDSCTSTDAKSKEEIAREEKCKAEDEARRKKVEEKKARKKAALALRKQQEEEAEAASPAAIFQKELLAALDSGDTNKLCSCLSAEFLECLPSELPGGLEQFLNRSIAEGNNTALHIASRSGAAGMVSKLLMCGADPSICNKKSKTPFAVAANKDVRQAFQDFRHLYPDKYDYPKAEIPLPLTEEEVRLEEEKKAAAKKAKKEKEKARLKLKAEEKAEREEAARFLALSDREKRALAAEKRILAAQRRGTVDESQRIVLVRCFVCGSDISGKTTFEYSNNRFCTVECLKTHRQQNPVNL
ncbi:hypothetical protein ONE63_008592 [Megalurothrips usitatus]|uniref:VLRF1 domain-containing protein n=1 Tax=Megalurothrips usitatus TaxID=439358 RepID=A0AAV7XLN0_9NEOP|nr:hypothetical protein ONE63_008592 [Megalurothrips usitatus]